MLRCDGRVRNGRWCSGLLGNERGALYHRLGGLVNWIVRVCAHMSGELERSSLHLPHVSRAPTRLLADSNDTRWCPKLGPFNNAARGQEVLYAACTPLRTAAMSQLLLDFALPAMASPLARPPEFGDAIPRAPPSARQCAFARSWPLTPQDHRLSHSPDP